MGKIVKHIGTILLAICLSTAALAQQNTTEEKPKNGPRRQLATIVFSGLGGAVLGLSTLSFYGRPQDHLNNIAIGFAVGIFIGAAFTTVSAAKHPAPYTYRSEPEFQPISQRKFIETQKTATLPVANFTF